MLEFHLKASKNKFQAGILNQCYTIFLGTSFLELSYLKTLKLPW
jgi:hypothetical protein